jgi:acyl-CoA synthetase (AMP-forming)/AMP-acid ligase II
MIGPMPTGDSSRETWSSMFAESVARDAPAVVTDDGVWTARDLLARAGGAADWLDAIGAGSGRPVAALIASRPDSFALALASISTERVLAPLGTRLGLRELCACLEPLDASVLVADEDVAEHAQAVGNAVGLRVEIMPRFEESGRILSLEADPGSLTAIIHTSGTSGTPKPVRCRQDRSAARARAYARAVGMGPSTLYATASPFHHTAGFGMLLVALANGATLLPLARFSADAWSELIRRKVTHGMLVPSMIDQLLDEGRLEPGALRVLQYGASQIHADTLRRMFEALPGIEIIQIYGQTEGAPVTRLSSEDHRRAVEGEAHLLQSAGRAISGVELRIDEPSAAGVGEVWARAEWLYVTDEQGWLHTGDLGRIDDEGYLYLVGRQGDMIIRGGENVYPEEVERVIAEHPAVREVAVVGVQDRRLGERIRAYVVPMELDDPPDSEALHAHARASMAGFKVPAEWVWLEILPRNAAGKLVRSRLLE